MAGERKREGYKEKIDRRVWKTDGADKQGRETGAEIEGEKETAVGSKTVADMWHVWSFFATSSTLGKVLDCP